ncbi:MAG: phage tail protein [Desulfobacteraceae bacterium]|nr:phage tail protein [Desulfobacteraceae bacterium]
MSEPFIGEIRMFPYTFYPEDWAECNGQLLSINEYQSLYAVLGTTYGGDGITTFGVPNLKGRTPVHPGHGIVRGMAWGVENVYLDEPTMPAHTHTLNAEDNGTDIVDDPSGKVTAQSSPAEMYGPAESLVSMDRNSISSVGGGSSHINIQPSMGLRFCIALVGMFPSRN